MPYAFVQATQGQADSSGTSITTSAFGGAVSAGSGFFFACTYYNPAGQPTITLSRGSDVFTVAATAYDTSSDYGIAIGYAPNVGTGTGAVTASYNGTVSGLRGLVVAEISGLDTSAPFGSGEAASFYIVSPGSATDSWSTGNLTPGLQPAAVIGFMLNLANATNTQGTGFTSHWTGLDFGYGVGNLARLESKRITSTTPTPVTFSGGDNYGLLGGIILREPNNNVSKSGSDTLTPILNEGTVDTVSILSLDDLNPKIAEASTAQVSLSRADTLTVGISESPVVGVSNTTAQVTSDTLSPGLTETAVVRVIISTTDTLTPGLTDSGTQAVIGLTKNGTDTLSPTLVESALVLQTPGAVLISSDQLTVQLDEFSSVVRRDATIPPSYWAARRQRGQDIV